MNKYILLWLEGPLQSWGDASKYGPRRTRSFPTKSAIYGILLAAMGRKGSQEELLAILSKVSQTTVSFTKSSSIMMDFHMVGSGYDAKDKWERLCIPKTQTGKQAVGGGSKITYRYYLQDASFAVIQELPKELVEPVITSLRFPVYGPSLGRKCNVPTEFLYQGLFDTCKDAKEGALAFASSKRAIPTFLVREGSFDDGENQFIADVPLRFGKHKQYLERAINIIDYENTIIY